MVTTLVTNRVVRQSQSVDPAAPVHAVPLEHVARGARTVAGTVNVDCDTLENYAQGYGFDYRDRPNRIFTKALPRLLDLLRETGVRATFFVIGQDLTNPDHREVFHRALAEGHELANHTWSHPRQFAGLKPAVQEREVRRTHDLVAEHFGYRMTGFRAPCYDMDAAGIRLLERLGYRYDSSVHPSPVVWLFDVVVWMKGLFRRWESRPNCLFNGFGPTIPYYPAPADLWRRGGPRQVIELPTNVWPMLRIPFYGTWHLEFGESWFHRGLALLVRHGVPLNYHLHAVELLGFREDGLDDRFACHPGMHHSLSFKSDWVRRGLVTLGRHYRLVTAGELAEEFAGEKRRIDAPVVSPAEEVLQARVLRLPVAG